MPATGHSAMAIGRMALVHGSLSCWNCGLTSIPAIIATWLMSSLGNDRSSCWQKLKGGNTLGQTTYLLKPSSTESTLWWPFTWSILIFTFFPHSVAYPNYLSLRILCNQFSNHLSLKNLKVQPNPWPSSVKLYRLLILAICFFRPNAQPRYTAQSSAHWKDFPSQLSFRDVSERVFQLNNFRSVPTYHTEPSANWSGVSFPFLTWLVIRNFP